MILSLSTVTRQCSLYAIEGDREILIKKDNEDMIKCLPEMMSRVINEFNIDKIDKLILSEGPGYITGIRIGISFAKGILLGNADNIVNISSLDALAIQLRRKNISVILRARKGMYHFKRYENNNGDIKSLVPYNQIEEKLIPDYTAGSIVIGEGVKYLNKSIVNSIEYENIFHPDAKNLYNAFMMFGSGEL